MISMTKFNSKLHHSAGYVDLQYYTILLRVMDVDIGTNRNPLSNRAVGEKRKPGFMDIIEWNMLTGMITF